MTKVRKSKKCKQIFFSQISANVLTIMKNLNQIIFSVIFLSSYTYCQSENAKLTVELMNSGFHRFVNEKNQSFSFIIFIRFFFDHRNLEYVVVFPDYQGKQHTFLIKQLLPSSVYISIDQLNDLNRFDKVNVTLDFSFYLQFFIINHFLVIISTVELFYRK